MRDRSTVEFVHRINAIHLLIVLLQVVQKDLEDLVLLECYCVVNRPLVGQIAFQKVGSQAISKLTRQQQLRQVDETMLRRQMKNGAPKSVLTVDRDPSST